MAVILLALNRGDVRLWRRNAGMAWAGAPVRQPDGSMLLLRPRAVYLGDKSMLDLQGFVMCDGVAAYVELEVKRPGKRPTKEQLGRIHALRRMGAIAGWADSVEMAINVVHG